jgi:hypothetical protein
MQKVLTFLGTFWAAIALVALIFGTMLEPVRHHIEEVSITGHLIQWFIVLIPGVVLAFLALKNSPDTH